MNLGFINPITDKLVHQNDQGYKESQVVTALLIYWHQVGTVDATDGPFRIRLGVSLWLLSMKKLTVDNYG